MKQKLLFTIAIAVTLCVAASFSQNLSSLPTFALGQPPEVLARAPVSSQPNLVEGREFSNPHGVAVDLTTGAIYVSDTVNNRVLAWADAITFSNGAKADLVVGQADFFSTGAGGPATARQSGLAGPTGVAVDRLGNLYVVDTGNNRIVVFPKPFEDDTGLARQVIGQPSLQTNARNQGGLSASSASTTSGSSILRCSIAFDAEGNLWFTDSGNHRVLRYPADRIGPDAAHGPEADVVLGQTTFLTNNALARSVANRQVMTGLREPSAVALDDGGRLYVADGLNRVLVYLPELFSGQPAARVMGIAAQPAAGETPLPFTEYTLGAIANNTWLPPEGVFTIGNTPFVTDTWLNRIMRYPPYDEWPEATAEAPSPAAVAVVGVEGMRSDKILLNRGAAEPVAGSLNRPVGAAVGFNQVFIADSGNNRVLVFPDLTNGDSNSVAQRVLGQGDFSFRATNRIEGREFFLTSGVATGGGIAIDRNAPVPHLYVADTNNHRILGFSDVRRARNGDTADIVIGQLGVFRSLVNSPANDAQEINATGLLYPTDVAVDEEGNVWVADRGNSRVLRFPKPFAADGSVIPGPYEANLVLGQFDMHSLTTDATQRTMAAPFALRFTVEGGLLVSDDFHNRVLLFEKPFESGMNASKVIGQPDFNSIVSGNGAAQFNAPRGLSSDISNRLYVADFNNNRILIFGDIRFTGNGPASVLSIGGMSRPRDVFVSLTTGKAWVADTNRNRILRFPRFDDLLIGGAVSESTLSALGPLSLEEDPYGSLFVADAYNAVRAYFPLATPTNAANYQVRLTPGMITSLFYQNTPGISPTEFSSVPLPRQLADVQVLLDGEPMPLFFVGPTQTNFLISNDAPESGTSEIVLLRPSTQQIIATSLVSMDIASPGMFTRPPLGTGQIAAINHSDGQINSSSHPVKPKDAIQLFGTGAGHIPGAPPDGEAAEGIISTPAMPNVFVNSRWLNDYDPSLILFSGLAPGLIGVWQVNIIVPDYVPDSDNVLVIINMKDRFSIGQGMATTIAVKK